MLGWWKFNLNPFKRININTLHLKIKRFKVIFDTGSTFMWIKELDCEPCLLCEESECVISS